MSARVIAGSVTLVVLMLVGCVSVSPVPTPTPTGDPSREPTPEIVGETVTSSPLESDRWVIAARAADLGYILAVNSGDFSIAQFVKTRSAEVAQRQFEAWADQNLDTGKIADTYPGPSVLIPLEVVVSDDGLGAEVSFCHATGYWTDGAALENSRVSRYRMQLTDGAIVFDTLVATDTACDATGAAIATFDPAPVREAALTASDVTPPPTR